MASEGVWDLPAEWETARLGRLVDIQSGFACSKKNLVAANVGVAHLRPFNVTTDGKVDLSEVYYITPDFKDNVGDYALEPGHVLFNNTNSVELVGKTALVVEPMACAFSNHIYRLALKESTKKRLEPAWLALALRRLWATGYFAEQCNRWIGQAGFNASKLQEVEIPLPPLDEQRRIVARIEALFDRMVEARRLRVAAEEEAGRLLEAELSQVFSTVVEKCETELLGKHGPLITSGPRHWSRYAQASPPGPLFLRVGNVGFATLQLDDIEYLRLPENAGEQRARVQTGDVLITITGTIGRCAVVPPDLPEAFINQHTALVRLDQERILPHYLMWFVLSPVGGNQTDSAAYGQTKPGLNLTQLRELKLPLPSLSEQRRIVAYLDGVQAQVAELKRLQAASAADLERLEGAVLARAFGGEL